MRINFLIMTAVAAAILAISMRGQAQTGVMAQDLYKRYPQAVKVGGDDAATDPWQVDYSKLMPVLIKAVQEQQEQIEVLKKENAELKAHAATVAQLAEEVNKLKKIVNRKERRKRS